MNVTIIHGPNLNLLGTREPDIYGKGTLKSINDQLQTMSESLGVKLDIYQSNYEGEIVELIQDCRSNCDGLIINPAAFTHYSIAIRDAIGSLSIPVIEVHLSNIYRREEFRSNSVISPVVTGQISGLAEESYFVALTGLINHLRGRGE